MTSRQPTFDEVKSRFTFQISDVSRSADLMDDGDAEASRLASSVRSLVQVGEAASVAPTTIAVADDHGLTLHEAGRTEGALPPPRVTERFQRRATDADEGYFLGSSAEMQRAIGRLVLAACRLETLAMRMGASAGVRNTEKKSLDNVVKAASRSLRKDAALMPRVDRDGFDRWTADACEALNRRNSLMDELRALPEPGRARIDVHDRRVGGGHGVDAPHVEALTQHLVHLLRSAHTIGVN